MFLAKCPDLNECMNWSAGVYIHGDIPADKYHEVFKKAEITKAISPIIGKKLQLPSSDVCVCLYNDPINPLMITGIYFNELNIVCCDWAFDDESFIKTLCHELVHCHQYTTGVLESRYIIDESKNSKPLVKKKIWMGEVFDDTFIPMEETPWELEAYLMEEILFGSVSDHLKFFSL